MKNELEELSMSLYLGSVTFLIGSGFSMHITEDSSNTQKSSAPTYLELLQRLNEITSSHEQRNRIKKEILGSQYNLQTKSGILETNLVGNHIDKNVFKTKIKQIIEGSTSPEKINLENVVLIRKTFKKYTPKNLNVFTTNYDLLLENFIFKQQSLNAYNNFNEHLSVESMPSESSDFSVNIYHLHGSIKYPQEMVITLSDYFKFEFESNRDYLQQKFQTQLHENSILILGYSLGDFNINRFLVHYNQSQKEHYHNYIYYVSLEKVDYLIKEHYSQNFGIHVIDETNLHDFFNDLYHSYESTQTAYRNYKQIEKILLFDNYDSQELVIKDFLFNNKNAFETIINIWSSERKISTNTYIRKLLKLLAIQKSNTMRPYRFEQYGILANWITTFLKTINIEELDDNSKDELEKLISYSWSKMSKDMNYGGYSWDAFNTWKHNYKLIRSTKTKKFLSEIKRKYKFKFSSVNKVEEIIQDNN